MSLAGVSLIRDGKPWLSGSSTSSDAGGASGYHLLVVEGYSHVKDVHIGGQPIESFPFKVGGYLWFLRYYPNGLSPRGAHFASVSLVLDQDVAKPVRARFRFSFADDQEPARVRGAKVLDFLVKCHARSYVDFIRRDEFEKSKHLRDDSFTLRCDVDVIEDDVRSITVPPPDMQRHFTDLLAAKEGVDVTFEVGGETIAAHRCILAARSRVFKAELLGPMKEGTAAAGAIHVEDMEPRVFRAMLAFIYSDLEPDMDKEHDEDAMWQWEHLLVAADRYDLPRLKLMCEDKICGFIGINTTTAILELAENHHCDGLRKACYNFLGVPGNLSAVAATDGFNDLITSYPSVMKELIAMLAP